ncbi:hypothetical protein J4474_02310 [Candidatus Pacearchaeota archaeon]|nr:hypothetical protein [Candidatus Pacearchaeota archaeon]
MAKNNLGKKALADHQIFIQGIESLAKQGKNLDNESDLYFVRLKAGNAIDLCEELEGLMSKYNFGTKGDKKLIEEARKYFEPFQYKCFSLKNPRD